MRVFTSKSYTLIGSVTLSVDKYTLFFKDCTKRNFYTNQKSCLKNCMPFLFIKTILSVFDLCWIDIPFFLFGFHDFVGSKSRVFRHLALSESQFCFHTVATGGPLQPPCACLRCCGCWWRPAASWIKRSLILLSTLRYIFYQPTILHFVSVNLSNYF